MAAYTFIGGPADGRTINIAHLHRTVRFFTFKIESPAGTSIAHPNEMRITNYILTLLSDTGVYFYRSEALSIDEACRGLQHRTKEHPTMASHPSSLHTSR